MATGTDSGKFQNFPPVLSGLRIASLLFSGVQAAGERERERERLNRMRKTTCDSFYGGRVLERLLAASVFKLPHRNESGSARTIRRIMGRRRAESAAGVRTNLMWKNNNEILIIANSKSRYSAGWEGQGIFASLLKEAAVVEAGMYQWRRFEKGKRHNPPTPHDQEQSGRPTSTKAALKVMCWDGP
ncbi:hypothetical protein DFJ73DRAFT_915047 [Zopfochytrium polystomum]|nr:hypothetical protein DFJ73DRAFT_915047 [Zopfochytrium polystomum]